MTKPMSQSELYERDYGVNVEVGGFIRGPVYDVQISTKAPKPPHVATLHLTDGSVWHPAELTHHDLIRLRQWIDRLLDDGTNWPDLATRRPEWWRKTDGVS